MDLITTLQASVGQDVIVPPHNIEPRFLGDWLIQNPDAKPAALAKPRSTAEVSTILRYCNEHGVAVVAQGGRTGLSGGALPEDGCLILSMERMRAIEVVDEVSAMITVESGVVLETVQEAAANANMLFPLDIGARGSCTIGGNIATNAGGNHVLRYGMMRDMVLGLEAVLADGTIVSSMNTMLKNNSGYDLKQLFVGSEGTLGVVTRANLRLFPRSSSTQTALCAVSDYADTVMLLKLARERLGSSLSAFEAMWPLFYKLGTDGLDHRAPIPHGYALYILIESTGTDQVHDQSLFQAFVEAAYEQEIIKDAVVAQSLRECEELWRVRDSSGELQQNLGNCIAFDVSLPIAGIGSFIDDCAARINQKWPEVRTVWFGHVADGNIHICVEEPTGSEGMQHNHELDTVIYDCVGEHDGSISAEHGIGVLKRDFLDRTRSTEEIATMRLLKRALDPKGILNPGKVLNDREQVKNG